ncbi:staphylopine family metallophore export MFS transporter CntE [Paenibacillus sp. NPDC057967]|uniref:staphylopine family metallophore export MFS transporter CntE n=1 Tax=Paenibacillus sp. NPDC057967 TaxID=3346293 RepID=UPI0036D816A3
MKGALTWPFLRLYALTLFYFSANSIMNVIIPLKGEAAGASNLTIGIIMGAYLFTTMFLRPWAGYLIQLHGPVKVLRVILLLNGVALVLYAFTGLGGYFAARVLQGICTAFFSMALQLGLIDALPDKDRSQGISMYSLCSYLPGIIGPLLAIGIWQTGQMSVLSAVMIGIAVLTGAAGYSVHIEHQRDRAAGVREKRKLEFGIWSSLGQLVTNPSLFKSSLLMLSASVVFGAVTAFVPLYAVHVPDGSAAVFLMIQAAVVVAVRLLFGNKIPSDGKWHSSFIITAMLLVAAASLCVSLAASSGAVLFYAGAISMGIAQALLYPALTTYLSFVLPKQNRNVLMGLFIATADMGVSLGAIIMGTVSDWFSYSFMYMLCAILSAAMAVVAFDRNMKPVKMKRQ